MKIFNFLHDPLPGDEVSIDDSITIPKGYIRAGMILKEKPPIKTDIFYVMLYPDHPYREGYKIIEVSKENMMIMRFINKEHYGNNDVIENTITILRSLLNEFTDYEGSEVTFKHYVLSSLTTRIDLAKLDLLKNNRKSHLSNTYGEVLNNGKIK